MRTFVAFAALLFTVTGARDVRANELTFDDRVAAQKAIEQVYWNHRIWPSENSGPKPPLSAVITDDALRAKVEDYIRKSNALEVWWHRPITSEQLQAEMDRMAKSTRDGATLRELYRALGSDALLIAETLARQTLVDRLIRSSYANDPRFHGDLKSEAEAALATCARADRMKSLTRDYNETTWKLRVDQSGQAPDEMRSALLLEADDWAEHLTGLARTFGTTADSLPVGRLSDLEESPEAFVATAILARRDGELTLATVAWPKRSFDAWWSANRGAVESEIDQGSGRFTIPDTTAAACTNDTWAPTRWEVPDPTESHTTVWTGAEMIVWGGGSHLSYLSTGGRYNPSTDSWTATSTGPNVPAGRQQHTAVWTGTEMVVWGGYNGAYLNTGGRYSPSTDSWTATSVGPNVPAGRQYHTAVWTGAEMIVWGGYNNLYLNTGGRYSPSTNAWLATSTAANVPSARYAHTAVWTGTEMIISGGSYYENTLGRYTPSTDSWKEPSAGANAPSERFEATAVWTGTEMIVWGGSHNGYGTNTGGRYDPSTDSWTATSLGANVPVARYDHAAVWTGTEMIVWGGFAGALENTGGRYDPATDSWTPTATGANVATARRFHTAVWTGTEMIVWGGDGGSGVGGRPLNTGARYSPSTDSWMTTSTGATSPIARESHTAVWTGTEMIVWAGYNGAYLNTGGRYNPAIDSWTATSTGASVPDARTAHTAVWTGTEMIVWGGANSAILDTGGRYNPATDSWTATSTPASVVSGRLAHTAVWTGKEMIVWGGYRFSQEAPMKTGGRYDPASDTWLPTSTGSNVPSARFAHTAVWTGTEMIIWGGSFYEKTGGRYNPSTDGWVATSTGTNVPEGRMEHTAVWTGTEMIIWGGFATSITNTGGRYTPSTNSWTPTSTAGALPAARYEHTAVWTGTEMIVWGGNDQLADVNTGGRYNPSTDRWSATSTGANVPSGRRDYAVVWSGSEMIVWGGHPSLASGGRYCASPPGHAYFRDDDLIMSFATTATELSVGIDEADLN